MTVAERIGALQLDRASHDARGDFLRCCQLVMVGGTPARAEKLAIEQRCSPRVIQSLGDMVYRAPTAPMSISGTADLAPFTLLANSFLASLSNSAFDIMLPFMVRVPLRSRIVATTALISGSSLAEQDLKRVSSLSLTAGDLEQVKTAAVVVLSSELVRAGVDGSLRLLEAELKIALALATDAKFLSLVTASAPQFASSGTTAVAARQDLRTLLLNVTTGAGSKLFLIASSTTVKALASMQDNAGAAAFPTMRVDGGEIVGGVRVIVSDSTPAGQLILADASGIVAASQDVRIDSSSVASLQLDSAPDSPPLASSNITSLWQQDLLGLLIERWFAARLMRASGCAVIVGASYSGSSPA